jgi:hypothetical protein
MSNINVKPTISEDLSWQDRDQEAAKLRYLSQEMEWPGLELRSTTLRWPDCHVMLLFQ